MTESKLYLGPAAYRDKYHTDPECYRLDRSDREPRDATEQIIEYHDMDECAACSGDEVQSLRENATGPNSLPDVEGYDPGDIDPDAIRADRRRSKRIADAIVQQDARPLEGAESRGGCRLKGENG